MRRTSTLIAAGIAAFLAFLVVLLPASLLLRFMPPDVAIHGLTGTVWRGEAAVIAFRGEPLGSLRWSSRPWRLPLLELDYRVELRPPGGELRMNVALERERRVELSEIQGTVPIAAFTGLVGPAGWTGTLEPDIARVVIVSGLVRAASGVIIARNLTAPGVRAMNIGSFELTLGEGAVGGESISGRLRDLGTGPMQVRATIELKPDRSYLVSGEVAAGPDAGNAVLRTLSFLGPPDSQGRRPFAIEGTL
jgi:general secretion pathway protein N